MPQPGGFQPQGYGYPPQGYPPPPPGGFNNGYNGYNDADDESEYEYITDDEGDFVEDEDGTILSMEEAQTRGLLAPAPECGERGIGKKLLIGGAVLGGVWMLRKQLKKKKKLKKQKQKNNMNPYGQQQKRDVPQINYGAPAYGAPAPNYGAPPAGYGNPNIYGAPPRW